ncbi:MULTISPECIES: hypothetical protein [unclassified Pseudoalteromonas]|uniref:hypothetical protein n=1 Tax=unclassified Pseudoalteromonas TaxID=194690 RepID=UPI00046415BD|nr:MULTISPECIES: hypothetical protein [unclassified Pseudoalteromonas]
MEIKSSKIFTTKNAVICSSIVVFSTGVHGSDVSGTVASSSVILILMSVLLVITFYMPAMVKSIMSKASLSLFIPLVVLSILKAGFSVDAEPMWTVLCIGVLTTLFFQIVADTVQVLPGLRTVLSYSSS